MSRKRQTNTADWERMLANLVPPTLEQLQETLGSKLNLVSVASKAFPSTSYGLKHREALLYLCRGLEMCTSWTVWLSNEKIKETGSPIGDLDGGRQYVRQNVTATLAITRISSLLLLAFALKLRTPPLKFITWHPFAKVLGHLLRVERAGLGEAEYRTKVARSVYSKLYRLRVNAELPADEAEACWSLFIDRC